MFEYRGIERNKEFLKNAQNDKIENIAGAV
jgi:hypothetical protein